LRPGWGALKKNGALNTLAACEKLRRFTLEPKRRVTNRAAIGGSELLP